MSEVKRALVYWPLHDDDLACCVLASDYDALIMTLTKERQDAALSSMGSAMERDSLRAENEALRHDIERHLAICAVQTTENEALKKELDIAVAYLAENEALKDENASLNSECTTHVYKLQGAQQTNEALSQANAAVKAERDTYEEYIHAGQIDCDEDYIDSTFEAAVELYRKNCKLSDVHFRRVAALQAELKACQEASQAAQAQIAGYRAALEATHQIAKSAWLTTGETNALNTIVVIAEKALAEKLLGSKDSA